MATNKATKPEDQVKELTPAEKKVYEKAKKQALKTFTKDEAKAHEIGMKAVARYRKQGNKGGQASPFGKSAEGERVSWEVRGTFTKFEGENKAFGWAYLAEEGGRPVERDWSGELATIEEVEKAAYPYVLKHRRGGDMHKGAEVEEGTVSTLIESMVVTQEKIDQMFPELPEETRKSMRKGWWVGFEYHDREVYTKVRSGEYADFSIGGSAIKRLAKGAYGIPQEISAAEQGAFKKAAREEIAGAESYEELSITAKAYLNLQAAVSQTEALEKGVGRNRHGNSIKCPDIYEALRREGSSKEKAAKISNECAGSDNCSCH